MLWILVLVLTPLNEYSQECGVPSSKSHSRVVKGAKATLGAWPWIASLVFCLKNEFPRCTTRNDHGSCSGTLISKKHVITAAHCIQHDDGWIVNAVLLGDVNLNPKDDNGVIPTEVTVLNYIIHPQYRKKFKMNDIAILTLERNVFFTQFIRPICLPTVPELRTNTFVGMNPFIAGWGITRDNRGVNISRPDEQLEEQLPVVDFKSCQPYYTPIGWLLRQNQLCAGGMDHSACQGDSGDPLMLPHLGKYYIIGINSVGFSCSGDGNPKSPNVFTRITSYLDWISNTIG